MSKLTNLQSGIKREAEEQAVLRRKGSRVAQNYNTCWSWKGMVAYCRLVSPGVGEGEGVGHGQNLPSTGPKRIASEGWLEGSVQRHLSWGRGGTYDLGCMRAACSKSAHSPGALRRACDAVWPRPYVESEEKKEISRGRMNGGRLTLDKLTSDISGPNQALFLSSHGGEEKRGKSEGRARRWLRGWPDHSRWGEGKRRSGGGYQPTKLKQSRKPTGEILSHQLSFEWPDWRTGQKYREGRITAQRNTPQLVSAMLFPSSWQCSKEDGCLVVQ